MRLIPGLTTVAIIGAWTAFIILPLVAAWIESLL